MFCWFFMIFLYLISFLVLPGRQHQSPQGVLHPPAFAERRGGARYGAAPTESVASLQLWQSTNEPKTDTQVPTRLLWFACWQEKVCQHVSCYVDLVVSSCNCLSHFHSFSLLSRKCPPQQWREREREQQEHVDRLQCCTSRTHGFNIGSSGAAACRNSEVESPESIYEKYVTGKVLLSSSLGRMGRAAN